MQPLGDKILTSAPTTQINSLGEPVLTGNKRYRVHKQWFKDDVLVLQLEFKGIVYYFDCGMVDSDVRTWWKDVKPEWMMTYTRS